MMLTTYRNTKGRYVRPTGEVIWSGGTLQPTSRELAAHPDRFEPVEEPHHVGGGWYELPDGTRVQGRTAALEAYHGRETDE